MDAHDLLTAAADGSLNEAELDAIATASKSTVDELFDAIARQAAKCFLNGHCGWERGDAAMNHLFGLAYGPRDVGLTEFAWQVYLAFDEGEYIHPGEPRTRKLLESLMAGG